MHPCQTRWVRRHVTNAAMAAAWQLRPGPNQGLNFVLHVLQPGIQLRHRPKWGQNNVDISIIDLSNPQKKA